MNTLYCLVSLAIIARGDSPDISLKSQIIDASVFKSGLVMLTRQITVPAGDGRYALDVVPEALDGSFWYHSSDNLLVTDVETTLRVKDESVKATAQTVGDYLAANVGHRVRLTYHQFPGNPSDKGEQIDGIVNGPPRVQANLVPIKFADGHLRNLTLSNIDEIDTTGLKSETTRTFKVPDLKIRFRAKTDRPSKMQFVTMEAGAAWVGSYLVDLMPSATATIVGKAQLGLGELSFSETNVRAIAGQPYLQSNGRYDLSSGVGPLTAYLQNSQANSLAYHPADVDPYTMLAEYANEQARALAEANGEPANDTYMYSNRFGGFGGYGGGRGGGGAGAGGPAAMDLTTNVAKQLAIQASMDRQESLYSYPLGRVTLEAGDRLSRILFSQSSTFENLYKWSTTIGSDDKTVKNLLRLHNTGTIPWTGGSVLITKGQTPLAQLEMPFTAGGKVADLEMANAEDILAKKTEHEVSRDTIPMPNFVPTPASPKMYLPREMVEVQLSLESTRVETSACEISVVVPGEVTDAAGGKVEKLLTSTDQWNRETRITWTFNLSPGDKREFKPLYRHLG